MNTVDEIRSSGQDRPADRLPVPRRRRWPLVLAALLILLAGIMIGSLGSLVLIRRAIAARNRRPEQAAEMALGRMRRELKLTDAQSERIRPILKRHFAELRRIREEVRPSLARELDGIETEVAAELTPQQAADWHRRFERLERWILPPVPPGERPAQP